MMKITIGENAGIVWRLLDQETEMPYSDLLKKSRLDEKDFYMAVGWLCRENKIYFFHKEGELYVCIVE